MEASTIRLEDIISVEEIPYETTYDISVDGNENFYIDTNTGKILVHNSGKTTWLKNLLVKLAMRHGWSHMIYSAEEASAKIATTDIMSIITSKTFFNTPHTKRMTREEVQELIPFMNNYFRYYSLEENECSVEAILAKAKEMIRRFGIRAIVIDNMSSVERTLKSNNKHDAIGDMMRELRAFARLNEVMIFIVAHPKKMSKVNGVYEIPTGYDVGDSSHYYNAPDIGITVYRKGNITEVHYWKFRFKFTGTIDEHDSFTFNIATSQYTPTNNLNDGSDKTKFKGQPIDQATIGRFVSAGTS